MFLVPFVFYGKLQRVNINSYLAQDKFNFPILLNQWAVAAATRVRVAYHLGANSVKGAKLAMRIGLYVGVFVGLIVTLTFSLGRNEIGKIYSDSPEVWKKTSEIAVLCGCAYLGLVIFYISMATLGAQGRPGIVAIAFVVGAWFVCVPLAYVFSHGYVESVKGLFGLWVAMTIGYTVVTLIAGFAMWRSDWDQCCKDAIERSEASSNAKDLKSPLLKGDEDA